LTYSAIDSISYFLGPDGDVWQAEDCQIAFSTSNDSFNTSNYGKNEYMAAGYWDSTTLMRGLLRFNLPPINNKEAIVAAFLVLSSSGWIGPVPDSATVNLHQVLVPWRAGLGKSENSMYHNDPDGTFVKNSELGEHNSLIVNGATGTERLFGVPWTEPKVGLNNIDVSSDALAKATVRKTEFNYYTWRFNISPYIYRWIKNSENNFGLLIKSADEQYVKGKTSTPVFHTVDGRIKEYRPQLIIYFDKAIVSEDSLFPFNKTVTIQPGPNETQMCQIQYCISPCNSSPLQNINNAKSQIMRLGDSDQATMNQLLMKFTIPEWINANKIIDSRLVVNYKAQSGISDVSFYAYQVLRSWNAGNGLNTVNSSVVNGATALERFYGSQNGSEDWNSPSIGLDNIDAKRQFEDNGHTRPFNNPDIYDLSFTITDITKLWIMDPSANHGVLLTPYRYLDNKLTRLFYGYADIYSGNYLQDPLKRPKLIITIDTTKTPKINFGMRSVYAMPGDTVSMPVMITHFADTSIYFCDITLKYDTSKLLFTGASKENSIVKNWSQFIVNNKADSISVSLSSDISSGFFRYGEGEIINCKFVVKESSKVNDSIYIKISKVVLNENQRFYYNHQDGYVIVGAPDILFGDVNGDSIVDLVDANLILKHVVGMLILPDTCCPNFTKKVADVSGNGFVTSYDAALVRQFYYGLLNRFPANSYKGLPKKANSFASNDSCAISIQSTPLGNDSLLYEIVAINLNHFISTDLSIDYGDSKISSDNIYFMSSLRTARIQYSHDESKHIIKMGLNITDNITEKKPVVIAKFIIKKVSDKTPELKIVESSINERNAIFVNNKNTNKQYLENKTFPEVKVLGKKIVLKNSALSKCISIWQLNGQLLYKKVIEPRNAKNNLIIHNSFKKGAYIYRIETDNEVFEGSILIVE
jgi:hypothetical protein